MMQRVLPLFGFCNVLLWGAGNAFALFGWPDFGNDVAMRVLPYVYCMLQCVRYDVLRKCFDSPFAMILPCVAMYGCM